MLQKFIYQIVLCGIIGFFTPITAVAQGWYNISSVGSSYTNANFNDIFFVDDTYGWAVGTEGLIIHTKDGGNTWVVQPSAVNTTLNGVFFISRKKGWIVGTQGVGKYTQDGGQTWLNTNSTYRQDYQFVQFTDSITGWTSDS